MRLCNYFLLCTYSSRMLRNTESNEMSWVPEGHCLALRSVSMRHSRTRILAWTIPRFSLSAELLLPAYVGLISFPISSITANNCAYFDWPGGPGSPGGTAGPDCVCRCCRGNDAAGLPTTPGNDPGDEITSEGIIIPAGLAVTGESTA
ncbi:hypothetical protein L798_06420 [Zootermopsis nevadensis]|uniref:Uncharacterized protein n=1 Tax=Zootermopsis nevadensis TaxID=136037 RepID=A0A067RIF7_ZOONE|nr:hypothetical protein L798_06420 [Zootermopsis nevadensis]